MWITLPNFWRKIVSKLERYIQPKFCQPNVKVCLYSKAFSDIQSLKKVYLSHTLSYSTYSRVFYQSKGIDQKKKRKTWNIGNRRDKNGIPRMESLHKGGSWEGSCTRQREQPNHIEAEREILGEKA